MVDLNKGATVELVKALSDDIRTLPDGTKASSAGAAVRNQITDLKIALSQKTTFKDVVFESGSAVYDLVYTNYAMNDVTGEQASANPNRASTPLLYYIPINCRLTVSVDTTTYTYNVYCFNEGGTYLGKVGANGTIDGVITLPQGTRYVRFFITKKDGTNISSETAKAAATYTAVYDGRIVQDEADIDFVDGKIDELHSEIEATNLILSYDFTGAESGYYINNVGTKTENVSYSLSAPIPVVAGNIIYFTARGYNQSVAMIASVRNGVYTPLVLSTDSTDRLYTYTVQQNMDIVLSYRTASARKCAILYDVVTMASEIADIYSEIADIYSTAIFQDVVSAIDMSTAIAGRYVDSYGAVTTGTNYSTTQPVYVEAGTVISVTATGYQSSTAIISEYIDGVYIPLVVSENGVTSYTYTTNRIMYIAVCFRTQSPHSGTIAFAFSPEQVFSRIGKLEDSDPEYLYLFHKMGGIGDSLMSGELYYSNQNHKDAYNYSWLSNLSKYAVNECVHYSAGGMTTKAWLEDSGGYRTALENEATPCDVYFAALGTNDKNQSVYQIGDITDTAGTASFVGYYKQIIELVHAKNPNAYIFCLSMYDSLPASIPYSNIVENIAELYSYCYFIDFASNTKHTPKTTDYYAQNSHYTSIGYLYAAQLIKKLVEEIINNNKNDFKWIGLN